MVSLFKFEVVINNCFNSLTLKTDKRDVLEPDEFYFCLIDEFRWRVNEECPYSLMWEKSHMIQKIKNLIPQHRS